MTTVGGKVEIQAFALESPVREADTVAERVAVIVDLMARFEWDSRKSARELSARWGVAVSTIQNYSAEASRLVTADADEIRREITLGGMQLLRDARAEGDRKGFALMGSLLADVSGASAAKRIEATVTSAATPAEAAQLVRRSFGEHASKKPVDGSEPAEPDASLPESASGG